MASSALRCGAIGTATCRFVNSIGLLTSKDRSHNAYFGIHGSMHALQLFRREVAKIWVKWFCRLFQKAAFSWDKASSIVAMFLRREIFQHEARGGGANAVDWYYGLLNHWNSDSLLDVFSALLGVLIVIVVIWSVSHLRGQERL